MKSLALGLAAALIAGCAHDRPQSQPTDKALTMMPISAIPSHARMPSWRDTPPPSDKHWPFIAPPDVRESRLPNGLTLYVIAIPEATTVIASVLTRAGANVEPLAKAGVAWLTLGALSNGGDVDTAGQLDRLGASLRSAVDFNGARLSLEVTPRHAERAVALLASIVRAPRFDPALFARLRQKLDGDLLQVANDPRELAQRVLRAQIFGADRRLALSTSGTRTTIATLTVDDAQTFAHEWIAPNTTALVLAGALDDAAARRMTEAAFGSWRGTAKMPPPTPPLRLQPRKLQQLEHAGLTRTLISFGRTGTAIGDDDAAPFELLTMLLGKLMNGELGNRQKLTQRVDVHARSEDNWGLLSGELWVGGDATGETLDAMAACLRGLDQFFSVDTDWTNQFRSRLQDDVTMSRLHSFDGVAGAVAAAQTAFFQGLPSNWLELYERRVRNVGGGDLRRVFARYFAPSELHVVVTAAPDKLRALKYTWPPESPSKKPTP